MLRIALFILLFGIVEAKEKPYFLDECPLVQLSGTVYFSIMPGAPNYEDVNNGDFPSERWFFQPNEKSKKYLCESGVFETIPDDFRPIQEDWRDNVDVIQLAASGEIENHFKESQDKELVLEGWLGTWMTHCYSLFFFEVSNIVNPLEN